MVLEEDRIPALFGRRRLAGGQGVLELAELPWEALAPDLALWIGELKVAELEEHREDAILADPLRQLLRADAVGLADREDIVAIEDVAAELVQEVEDARRVGRHLMDAG